ncbi:type I polyketide synthase [Nevskia soli]|uniref:type I polyketide synthase n=1 Tax=Nevskia soli TaxID=418856 RepID=UPI00068EFC67|nr:type I polyketide synthase [Nevskia soli]
MSKTLDIAIVGLAGSYAGARNLRAYWQNILDKVDSVGEADAEWAGPYLDVANCSRRNDRIYTTMGGFLRDLAEVDPAEFGVMPSMADGGDPDHLLALKHARDALADAGYLHAPFNRERAGIVLGRGTYSNRGQANVLFHGMFMDQAMDIVRKVRPDMSEAELEELRAGFKKQLPPYSGEMVGPLTPNVITGMIANRLDLMGPNYIVDAACASSLIAVNQAVQELVSGRCDLMLTGGVHAQTPPQLYIQFCQIQALSHGKIRPFQKGANGTLLGEGVGVMVLKRLADAERDGDRVYAVIKGIGIASDGKAKGLLTPRLEGEVLALKRAYESSGIDPASIGLIEAHGTGTAVGDRTEIQSLSTLFGPRSGKLPDIAIGTVKSMISHCLPAAGSAAMLKTALALHHKILPPTLCDEPDPGLELERTPFYINNEARPWIHGAEHPRRAGVNAFGFGGINAHIILEEYRPQHRAQVSVLHAPGVSELVVFAADSAAALADSAERILTRLRGNAPPSLAEVAKAAAAQAKGEYRLALVCTGFDDLVTKLEQCVAKLRRPDAAPFKTRSGMYYGHGTAPGRVCFLFPGEGSQYPNMLGDLCMNFPQVRDWFDFIEEAAHKRGSLSRAPILNPPPTAVDEATLKELDQQLYDMDVAAELVFAASMGLQTIFDDLGLRADAMLGHSTGENTAITVSGVRRFERREEIAEAVGELNRIFRKLDQSGQIGQGTLLTIGALRPDARRQLLARIADGTTPMLLAMDNCPNQLVLYGSAADVHTLREQLAAEGAVCAELPFGRPYHTAQFKPVADAYRAYYDSLDFGPGRAQLYSACSTAPFPHDAAAIRELATAQWDHPVRFVETIERLYADGVRVFIEVGPSGNLTSFVSDTLRDKDDVVAVASNSRRRSGVAQLHHTLAQVYAAGVTLRPEALYTHRDIDDVDLAAVPRLPTRAKYRLKLQMPGIHVPEGWSKPFPAQQAAEAKPKVVYLERPTPAAVPAVPAAQPAAIVAPAPAKPSAPADPRLQALQTHFSLMQDFLDSQSRVLGLQAGAFAGQPQAVAAPAGGNGDPAYPLLGRVVERSAERLVMECSYDPDTHLFLRDHAIGPAPSAQQPGLRSLIVMPFTLSMEILAEAGSSLAGSHLKVVGIENARGSRWLGAEDGPLRLRIVAEKQAAGAAGEARVMVRLFLQEEGRGPALGVAVFEGLVVLAAAFPAAPAVRAWTSQKERGAINNPAGELYSHGMFHGPRLQGVTHLRRWSETAIEADMTAISTADYFSFTTQPTMRMDGALLDAVGQLAAYWLTEKFSWDWTCFPFQVGHYTQYADPPPAGTRLICRGDVAHKDGVRIEAHFDVFDEQGRLIVRAANWGSRTFTIAKNLHHFRIDPVTRFMSDPWMTQALAQRGMAARLLQPFAEGYLDQGGGLWQRMIANLVLNTDERRIFYRELPPNGPRREEWLVGRIAAKEAVREWLAQQHGLHLASADIEIANAPNGQPYVSRVWGLPAGITAPAVSISHSSRGALAACAPAGARLGVDYQRIERIEAEDLIAGAFSAAEAQQFLRSLPAPAQKQAAVALWCAKEAAAKASGGGLEGRPLDWTITAVEAGGGAGQLLARVRHGGVEYRVELHNAAAEIFALCRAEGETGAAPLQARA